MVHGKYGIAAIASARKGLAVRATLIEADIAPVQTHCGIKYIGIVVADEAAVLLQCRCGRLI
jgi:hypothetical protein